MGKTVLILGGSMAGLGVAHRLLKYTLPNEKDLKVIMVSKVKKEKTTCASPKRNSFHSALLRFASV